LRREDVGRGLDDVGGLREAARTGPAAREEAVAGADDMVIRDIDAALNVDRREWMTPHVDVHRRREQDGRLGREHDRADGVVGAAIREPRDQRGGRGRDDHEVRAIGELDVPDLRFLGERPQIREDRAARQRLERHRPDELLGGIGHRDLDARAGLVEQADELGGLVRRDAAADGNDDGGTCEGSGRIAQTTNGARCFEHRAYTS
jgi:hypothetical protein